MNIVKINGLSLNTSSQLNSSTLTDLMTIIANQSEQISNQNTIINELTKLNQTLEMTRKKVIYQYVPTNLPQTKLYANDFYNPNK